MFKRLLRQDVARLAELLDEDLREFSSSGRTFARAKIMGELREKALRAIALRNV